MWKSNVFNKKMKQFVKHNGAYFASDQPLMTANNRAFCYGDALFETIRIANHHPQFLKEHLQRLFDGMEILKMQINPNFTETFFENAILELAKKNQLLSDGRVRISIYRNAGGFYAPEDNSVSYIIEVTPLEEKGFTLNTKGYKIDIYTGNKKPISPLSSIKSANSAIYVLAGIYKKTNFLDECLLVNDKGNITEAISSNIFAVKNGVLYTSPISDGCIDGVMRKKIIELAMANRVEVDELSIMQNVLLGADELFLTNAINGIRWVLSYKQKIYSNKTSTKLMEKLNELIYQK